MSIVRSDPELAALLGLEALTQMDNPAAVSALRVALAQLPDLQIALAPGADLSSPRAIAFAPDGRRVAIADGRSSPRVGDLASHTVSDLGASLAAPVAGVRWSPDGALIAAVDTKGGSLSPDGGKLATVDEDTRATGGSVNRAVLQPPCRAEAYAPRRSWIRFALNSRETVP